MTARELGDYRKLTATAASTEHGRFVDTRQVYPTAEPLIGGFLVLLTGTNAGTIVRVHGNNRGAGELHFTPNAAALTAQNDEADMVNLQGSGWDPYEYHDIFDDIIKQAGSLSRFKTVLADYTFDGENPDLTIDRDLYEGVEQIQWFDEDWGWQEVPPALRVGEDGWWADPASGKVYFQGGWDGLLDTHSVRVTVYGEHAALADDAAETTLDPEYVVTEACYRLLRGGIRGDPTRYTIAESIKEKRERMQNVIRSRGSMSSQAIRLN